MHEFCIWDTTSSKDTGLRNLPFDADSHDNHRGMGAHYDRGHGDAGSTFVGPFSPQKDRNAELPSEAVRRAVGRLIATIPRRSSTKCCSAVHSSDQPKSM
jgi:hypothetical protein